MVVFLKLLIFFHFSNGTDVRSLASDSNFSLLDLDAIVIAFIAATFTILNEMVISQTFLRIHDDHLIVSGGWVQDDGS